MCQGCPAQCAAEVVDRVLAVLAERGLDYEAIVSEPVGRSRTERYAFMWRPVVVQILGDIRIYPDPDDGFIREPAVADFQAGTFDFAAGTPSGGFSRKSTFSRNSNLPALAGSGLELRKTPRPPSLPAYPLATKSVATRNRGSPRPDSRKKLSRLRTLGGAPLLAGVRFIVLQKDLSQLPIAIR